MIKDLIEKIAVAEAEAEAIRTVAEARRRELIEGAEVAAAAAISIAEERAKADYDKAVAEGTRTAEEIYCREVAGYTQRAQELYESADIKKAADYIVDMLSKKYADS